MLTALVLVCSLTATPDLRACNESNAVDVMRVPEQFSMPSTCFMHGQAYVAQTEFGRQLSEGESVKVVCTPTTKLSARGSSTVIR
jgi:hypothetical protein